MNGQDLFSAQKCDSLPHTLLIICLTSHILRPKLKTATEPEHAQIMPSDWDVFSVARNGPPLSPGIEPATFRYNGRYANHNTTAALKA